MPTTGSSAGRRRVALTGGRPGAGEQPAVEGWLSTAPVLAVLVCHNGEQWLPRVLAALGRLTVRPRHVLAVDTGSSDGTAELLERAAEPDPGQRDPTGERVLDGVLTTSGDTGFGAAVEQALEHGRQRWGDPGRWLWLLHDDSAPEPDCLADLLRVADTDSGAALLGPLGLDWQDPRLVVDHGLSLDTSGHVQTGTGPSEIDPALSGGGVSAESPALQVSEVLAVSSACSLVRRDVFERLDGFDEALPVACDDVDLGWRVNAEGHLVLCVPGARMRHATALRRGTREPGALRAGASGRGGAPGTVRAAQRAHGVRTFLVNTTGYSFVLGLPRLVLFALLRALGSALLHRMPEAGAELTVVRRVLTGRFGLSAARTRRRTQPQRREARALLTSRLTRLRNGLRDGFVRLVRDRVRRDVVAGRATPTTPLGAAAESPKPARPVGPQALPLGALGPPEASVAEVAASPGGARRRRVAGLRRPSGPVVVPIAVDEESSTPSPGPRPSPMPREQVGTERTGSGEELLLVPVDRSRMLRELVLTPPVLLAAVLLVFALVTNGLLAEFARFGPGLHGGRLLPVADLGETWSEYLAAWHPAHGGTSSPAPASLLVLALLGTVLAPLGGPPTVVSLLMLFGVPLAGVAAYRATRPLPVSRRCRACAAAAYALLPAVTMSAAHGRLGVVVAHVLVPPVLAGAASVLGLTRLTATTPEPGARPGHWLGTSCLTALGLAVLAAFAPLMHVVMLVLVLLGFVFVPATERRARPRAAGLAAIVLLPVACLLPWPVALVRHPQILVHGLGARVVEQPPGIALLALNPDGSPAGWAGAVLVVAAAGALLLTRSRAVLPGIVVALVGWVAAVLVTITPVSPVWAGPDTVGWAGGPLVLVAAGLLWIVLAAVRGARRRAVLPWSRRAVTPVLAAALLVLASGAALAGAAGPLRIRDSSATPALVADLAEPGYLLVMSPGPQPPRLVAGTRARFATDSLVPAPTATDWLHTVGADLSSGVRERVRGALAAAAARGAGFVAVPNRGAAERLRALAGDLLENNGHLADGRPVLRVLLPSSPVELLGPALAERARGEAVPQPRSRPVAVQATLPHVAVRVSPGGAGRLLVLAAENEPGWQAWVDGRPVPLATAWGHQVAVPLPEQASKVRVTFTRLPRTTLLVVQAAAILFTLIAALPARRRRGTEGRERSGPTAG